MYWLSSWGRATLHMLNLSTRSNIGGSVAPMAFKRPSMLPLVWGRNGLIIAEIGGNIAKSLKSLDATFYIMRIIGVPLGNMGGGPKTPLGDDHRDRRLHKGGCQTPHHPPSFVDHRPPPPSPKNQE